MSLDRLKFSIKASLSLALVVLISFSLGWVQITPALVTIMIIASVGSVGDSVNKGILRIIGTVSGATIGMFLIAIFPQDRELYLFTLSILVTITLYITRAYKGDNSIFMLTAITMMMMFNGGAIEDSFMFGIDKTFMTIFGIAIYTLIGIFLWPVSIKDDTIENIISLSIVQQEVFNSYIDKSNNNNLLIEDILSKEQALIDSNINQTTNALSEDFSDAQWQNIIKSNKKINELLMLISYESIPDTILKTVKNYHQGVSEINILLGDILLAWQDKKEITVMDVWTPKYDSILLQQLTHLEIASDITISRELASLHRELRELALNINLAMSPTPTLFEIDTNRLTSNFIWWDKEDLKGAFISFIIFWFSTFLWIEFNPPAGFMIVTLATAMSILTTFSPIKPSILMIVFSIAFIFASLMYIAVLPQLYYGWELGLFVFFYGMIGFYLMPPKLSLFFLMGMLTLGLANEMNYNFAIFLITLFVFYAFLSLLMIFYYIPFSTKPEDLFTLFKNRFFYLSKNLVLPQRNSWMDNIKRSYSTTHLMPTVKKMQLWSTKLNTIDNQNILEFTKESQKLAYLILLMNRELSQIKENPILKLFEEQYPLVLLNKALISLKDETKEPLCSFSKELLLENIEERLNNFFISIEFSDYQEEDISSFYGIITLRKRVWKTLFRCEELMVKIDFEALKISRF